MTRSITWVHHIDEARASLRANLGRDAKFVAELARYAGSAIPIVEGRLADVGPADGFIVWTAYGLSLGDAFAARSIQESDSLVTRFAPRLVQIDASTSRIFEDLERLSLAAAIDVSAHRSWQQSSGPEQQGLYGRREIASAIGATCRQGSEYYGYLTSDRHEGLPHLLADYLRVLGHDR